MKKTIIAIGVLAAFSWATPAALAAGTGANMNVQGKAQSQASIAAKKRAARLDTARANAALAGSSNVDADARRSLRGG